jgi:transketolase
VNVLYFHTIKPLDTGLLERFAATKIVVVHDAFGLLGAINSAGPLQTVYHGLPDEFCCYYGTTEDIRRKLALDPEGIRNRICTELESRRLSGMRFSRGTQSLIK